MRKIFTSLMLLTGVMAFGQSLKPFEVKGSFKNISDAVEKVFISYKVSGSTKNDSTLVQNNTYKLVGNIAEPVRATLRIKYAAAADGTRKQTVGRRDIASVFLSPSPIKIISVDSFSNIKVTGSIAHTAYSKLAKQLQPVNNKMAELDKQWIAADKAKDTIERAKVEALYDGVTEEMNVAYKKYIEANPSSPVAIYAASQFAGYDIDADKAQAVFDKLSPSLKDLPSATELGERIEIARKTGIGRMAMDFTQNDTLGVPVKLSSLRGKVLLVDFWASWCGPCRRENPNVVKAFNQYKDKGFHILGVSLDQPGAKEKWMKAIHDDNLTWTHVSDLKFWDNEAAKDYGIRGIPYNLLLDKEGKIIGKNLRGEGLEKKLSEVFN